MGCARTQDGGFAALLDTRARLRHVWTIDGCGSAVFAGPLNSDFLPMGPLG